MNCKRRVGVHGRACFGGEIERDREREGEGGE